MSVAHLPPAPRSKLSRNVLTALAAGPATMADALRDLRSIRQFGRLSVGRFFEEVDRLIDAGYLRPVLPGICGPVEVNGFTRVRHRSGRLRARLWTAAFRLDVDLSTAESDCVSGGDEL